MKNTARMAADDSVENGERARPRRRSTRLASNLRGGCDRMESPAHAQPLAVERGVRYVFSVFDECLPLPPRCERGEGRGNPNTTRRCSLLSPALSSLRYLFSALRALCCSADFQSAVSPTCSRRSVGSVPRTGVSQRLAECNSAIQQSTTLRYDRALNTYSLRGGEGEQRSATLNAYGVCQNTRGRAHLDTTTGARAVPDRSTSLGTERGRSPTAATLHNQELVGGFRATGSCDGAADAERPRAGRRVVEHSAFPPAMQLRTGPSPRRSGFGHAGGTVRGPAVAVSRCTE